MPVSLDSSAAETFEVEAWLSFQELWIYDQPGLFAKKWTFLVRISLVFFLSNSVLVDQSLFAVVLRRKVNLLIIGTIVDV